jgi:hypothetical protein
MMDKINEKTHAAVLESKRETDQHFPFLEDKNAASCQEGGIFEESKSVTSTVLRQIRSPKCLFNLCNDSSEDGAVEERKEDGGLQETTTTTKKSCLSSLEERGNRRIHDIVYHVEVEESNSSNINKNPICTFDWEEIIPGTRLGRGAFADVWEIRGFNTDNEESTNSRSSATASLQRRRSFLAESCLALTTGKARYAIKQLRQDLVIARQGDAAKEDKAQGRFWASVIDLALESRILSQLEHPVSSLLKSKIGAETTCATLCK